MKAKKKEK
jgi:hypothetical protein